MRRNFRRRGLSKDKTFWSTLDVENVNHNYQHVNILGGPGTGAGQPDIDQPARLLKWNPFTPNVVRSVGVDNEDAQEKAFLKRLIIKIPVLAQVQYMVAAGDQGPAFETTRDDIPFTGTGGLSAEPTVSGYLLNGGIGNNQTFGSMSWAEGIPLNWALIYETFQESQVELYQTDYLPATPDNSLQNRREFMRGVTVPTVYKPGSITIDKTFPGRGVMLANGDRQTFQVSLAVWMPTSNYGTGQTPSVGVYFAQARAKYGRV